jgi:membrane-anchored protein YejM (alkaline phosphatase superfamily)
MVLNILLSPAAYKNLDMGSFPIIAAIVVFIFLILFEFFLIKLLKKDILKIDIFLRIFKKNVLPLLIINLIAEKFIFGFASLFDKKEITLAVKTIPLYQPLTFNSIAKKYFGIEKKVNQNSNLYITISSRINYPLKELEIKNPNPKNIFIIGIDALRNDLITPETAPNIYKFAQESLWYTNNISGGNATRFGIFTLFYSLNAPYWFNFVDAKKGALFFNILKKLNYNISIFFSTSAKWPEFRETVFFNIQDKVKDRLDSRDTNTFRFWKEYIKRVKINKPIFNFTFLNAPHGRYYPKKFAKFKPDKGGEINYLIIKKRDKNILLNQYKNAILYDDYLFGKMLEELKKRHLYKDSIIILTSDHGEEFYEYGYFGHNTAFDKSQVNSPLIVKLPNQKHKIIPKLSSSLDLIPSLLRYLGVKTPSKYYSNGYSNLFSKSYQREFATSGNWNYNSIITPKYTYVFSNLPNKIMKTEKLDTKAYKPLKNTKEADKVMQKFIIEVLNQNRRFLK